MPLVSMARKPLKVSPARAGSGCNPFGVSMHGPHVWISSTFSMNITRGRTASAHLTTTHESPRISFLTGTPPRALEKCVQSGEAHRMPTFCPAQTSFGSTAKTSSCKCRVQGWFVLCIRIASASWLIAMSTGLPVIHEIPVSLPPPPAKSTTLSSSSALF